MGEAVPAQREAAARVISVVVTVPIILLATTLMRDAGPPLAAQKAGIPGIRCRGASLPSRLLGSTPGW